MSEDKKNSLWLALQYSVSIIAAFITLKLNIDHYGKELFGVWLIFSSVWGVGSIIDLGFGTAIIKYIAEAKKLSDKDKISSLISTGSIVFLSIGLFLLIIGILIGHLFYFNNRNLVISSYSQNIFTIYYLLGLNFFIYYYYLFLKSILEGLSDFVLSSKLVITSKITLLLFVLVITYINADLTILALAFVITSFLLLVLNFLAIRYKYNDIKFSLKLIEIPLLKKIFKFSFSVQVSNILFALIDPIIKYIIGNYSQVSVVSLYEICRRFSTAISGLYFTSFRTILPKTSILLGRADYKSYFEREGMKNMKLGIAYSGITFGIGSIIIAFLITIWFRIPEAIIIFLILSIPEAINNFGYTLYNFVLGIGKPQLVALIQLINLITMSACTALGFIFLGNDLGLLGYTFSVLISSYLLLSYTQKISGIALTDFIDKTNLVKLFLLISLMLLIVFIIYFNLIPLFISVGILSLISAVFFGREFISLTTIFKKIMKPNQLI